MRVDRAKLWDVLIETPGTLKEFAEAAGIGTRCIYRAVLNGTCQRRKLKKLAAVLGVDAEDFIIDDGAKNSANLDVEKVRGLLQDKYGATLMAMSGGVGVTHTGLWQTFRRGRCTRRTLGKIAKALGVEESTLLRSEA